MNMKMFFNRKFTSPLVGSTTAVHGLHSRRSWSVSVRGRGYCLPLSTAARLLMIVFLIVIENVSYISSQQQQQQQQQQKRLSNVAVPSSAAAAGALAAASTASSAQHVLLADTHRLAKRMDLEACLGQFDIHANTIIRTGDSQAIGGKFLQGLELDTMEQCQRLCCETESCDVYIFESKSGSYCYLFECGPPENFHCKFTRHANFTSAVLTPIKRFVEVTTHRPPPPPTSPPQRQAAPSISQQEWELTSLKVKPETTRDKLSELEAGINSGAIGSNVQHPQQQQPQQQQQQSEIGFPQKAIVNNSATPPHCGRFQFACHSGECIAIYNACDGIPQCEDGSDEGPECLPSSQSNGKGNADSVNINSNAADATAQKYRPTLMQQTPQQQLQTIQQQQQQRQLTQPINSATVNNREDANAWVNRKIATETHETDGNTVVDLNSHIFTHKNGLQLPHTLGGMENTLNGATNIGSIDLSTGIASYPNSNGNLNSIYEANIQHNGIFMPQAAVRQPQIGGRFAVPPAQQTLMDQQGHIYAEPNINWAQQQQQQQQQQSQQPQQQFPVVVTPLTTANERGTSLAQGPAYVINTQQQADSHFLQQQQQPQHQHLQQQQQQTQHQSNVAFLTPNDALAPVAPASQQTQASNSQNAATVHDTPQPQKTGEASKGSTKKALGTADDSYETDYEDESTEPPKKKLRKHKKVKAKPVTTSSSAAVAANNQSNHNTNTNSNNSKSNNNTPIDDDPVQQAMVQRKQALTPTLVREQFKMIHENLAMEFHDHDGQSDRPGGAVLSLTLGLLVTAALAILIGCRMRTVGRRARRLGGKTPYSHEADFLVNGMYL